MDDQANKLRELMKERRRASTPLRVIGVASGKGGVGKTNITTNLAMTVAKSGKRVLIIDGDLGLANVEILMGIKPKYHLGHVLESDMPISDVLATGPLGVKVLPAGTGVQNLSRLDDLQRMRLIAALDCIEEEFDVVLLDAGAGIGDNVLFFVGGAQEALLVVNPEPTSLTDAYAAVKVLCADAGVRFFNIVVNQAPNEATAKDVFDKLGTVASRFLDARMRFVGWLPRDENVHRAVMAQRPLVELFPQSPASRALAVISDNLFHEPPPVHLDGGLKFLWNRLHRAAS